MKNFWYIFTFYAWVFLFWVSFALHNLAFFHPNQWFSVWILARLFFPPQKYRNMHRLYCSRFWSPLIQCLMNIWKNVLNSSFLTLYSYFYFSSSDTFFYSDNWPLTLEKLSQWVWGHDFWPSSNLFWLYRVNRFLTSQAPQSVWRENCQ